jgi:pimeloyl-ACP methyl ester carboxylesterase
MLPTIVLIHGAWMNPESWAPFQSRYEARGYTVIAPAWPYDDRTVAELRANPDPKLASVGVTEIVDHYAEIIRGLDQPPILVGHSFGGLFVQMLLDRGLGVAGVAIDPAPPKGVLPSLNALKASWPVASTPGFGKKVFSLSFEDFQWGWVHTLPETEQRAAFEYTVPTPGKVYQQGATAPFTDTLKVNFRNDTRAPLLIIAGEEDRTVSASMNRKNYELYRHSKAVTDFHLFPGRTHWIIAQPGWEEVADYAITWVEAHLPKR